MLCLNSAVQRQQYIKIRDHIVNTEKQCLAASFQISSLFVLDVGLFVFTLKANRFRVQMESSSDHFFQAMSTWLFCSASECDCCGQVKEEFPLCFRTSHPCSHKRHKSFASILLAEKPHCRHIFKQIFLRRFHLQKVMRSRKSHLVEH